MKKILSVILTIALFLCCVPAMAEGATTVAVVYSDTVDDKGWCQAMDEGIKKAIAAGANVVYTAVESVAVPTAAAILDQLAGEYDIIIIHGAQFTTACTEIAEEYPEQVFVLGTSDRTDLGDNIFTYMPQSEETGYVNGIIAALLTKVGKIGVVGSQDNGDSARYVRGYYMGAKSVNEAVEVLVSWTGSFSDTIGANDIAKTFIEAGCDIMTGASQQAIGGIRAAEAAGNVTWLGQTLSQLNDFPAVVVAAGDYDYAAVLVSVLDKLANGVTGGECIPMNFNNNGFVYEFSENVPAEVKAAAEEALAKLTAEANTIASYIDVQF